MKNPSRRRLYIPLWLIWLTALAFALAGLGSSGILDNNEGLYAGIALDMLEADNWRNWIIPHLNGLPYLEKPPLLYWLTALSFAIFGVSEWSARLVPALSSLACIAMLLQFGLAVRRPRAGRLAALMLASGIGMTAMSRLLMFDMLLTALLSAALMCTYLHLHRGAKGWLRLAYACLALAVLTKGSVALLLFGLVVLAYVLASGLRDWRTWIDPGALLIFLAIASPWHIFASLAEPAFSWLYFYNEHVLRFLGQREPRDYYAGSWWYYLPRMMVYLFPWSFLLFCVYLKKRQSPGGVGLHRFLWLAWLLPLLFFSASSAKANYYMIAAMPFVSFHLACMIEKRNFLSGIRSAVPGLLIAFIAACLCAWVVTGVENTRPEVSVLGLDIPALLFLTFLGLAALSLAAAYCAWRHPKVGILGYLILPAWLSAGLLQTLTEIQPLVSTRPLVTYIQNTLPDHRIYIYRDFEELSSLNFYLKKSVSIIDSHSKDLFWGNRLYPNDILIPPHQFHTHLGDKAIAIVVDRRQLKHFQESSFSPHFREQTRIGDLSIFIN